MNDPRKPDLPDFPIIDGECLIKGPVVVFERKLWWLSFCDPDRPAGSHSIGICIVEGFDFGNAVAEARTLGCNPGGEVFGLKIPDDKEAWVREHYPLGKLMTRAEVEAFDGKPCVTVGELEDEGWDFE